MLEGIHFLLTYNCNFECEHCFLNCSPKSEGTFTFSQIKKVLDEAPKIKSIKWIYFEGGEPFLYYPLMLEGIKLAKDKGFKVGVVTNFYWAKSIEDAEIWLKALADLGINDFSISDDYFHYEEKVEYFSKIAKIAAKNLNIPINSIKIENPKKQFLLNNNQEKGKPIIGGNIMFRGRAIDNLIKDLPKKKWDTLKECPYEDLEGLGRIHLDCFGNTQICQGLSIGNFLEHNLSELIKNYSPKDHPICGPLIRGGPLQLIKDFNLEHENKYVDECHLCFLARKALIDLYPQYLGPRHIYGLE
ncbi:MAG: 4Fe-4S cluster-binding domain-containing protein [Promethearchaeota archaeon]|nr:MAG: 4Fe-4S cluster-binding domain-containing protein [Candidatus Lokiarchaeota archaeon]